MANPSDGKIITLAQLSEHNTQQNLWIAVNGKVYDLTSFAKDHPGGIDVLNDCAGTDGSEPFEYAGHSAGAVRTMQKFLVGSLAGYDTDSVHTQTALVSSSAAKTSSGKATSTLNLGAWTRPPLLAATFCVLAILCWIFGGATARDGEGVVKLKPAPGVSVVYAFLGGLLLASSLSGAAAAVLYSRFSETLKHEKEVFSYPPIIPRRRVPPEL